MKNYDILVDDPDFEIDSDSLKYPEAYAAYIRVLTQWNDPEYLKERLSSNKLQKKKIPSKPTYLETEHKKQNLRKKINVAEESADEIGQAILDMMAMELSEEFSEEATDKWEPPDLEEQQLLEAAAEALSSEVIVKWPEHLGKAASRRERIMDYRKQNELNDLRYLFGQKATRLAARQQGRYEKNIRTFYKDGDTWGEVEFTEAVHEGLSEILPYADLDLSNFVEFVEGRLVDEVYSAAWPTAVAKAKENVKNMLSVDSLNGVKINREVLLSLIKKEAEFLIDDEVESIVKDSDKLKKLLSKVDYEKIYILSVEKCLIMSVRNFLSRESTQIEKRENAAILPTYDETEYADFENHIVDFSNPEDEIIARETLQEILQEIKKSARNSKSAELRTRVFFLHFLFEKKNNKIAQMLSISETAISKHVKKIEEILASLGLNPAPKDEHKKLVAGRKAMHQRKKAEKEAKKQK